MKTIFKLIIIAIIFASCGNNKKSNANNAHDMYDWMGSYSNDTITFIFKDKGVCDVITPKNKFLGCDYTWDVEGNNICVVDANQNIYLLEVKDGFMTSNTGSIFKKIK